MKKILFFTILSGLTALHTFGQQRLQVSQYMMNYYLINPAITGIYGQPDIKIGYRNQWTGLAGSPKTFFLTAHTPIGGSQSRPIKGRDPDTRQSKGGSKKPTHGIGVNIGSDNVGPMSINSVMISYAYHMQFSEKIYFSVGASPGIVQYRINNDDINLPNKQQDNAIKAQTLSTVKPDLNLGTWLYGEKFFVGLSTFQMFRNKFLFADYLTNQPGRMKIHYNLTSGYKFSTGDIDIIPSFLLKYVDSAPAALDLNMRVNYKNKIWAGTSYRVNDAVAVMVGFNINNKVSFSYSYDITTSRLNKFNSGTHEIMLGIRLSGNEQRLQTKFY